MNKTTERLLVLACLYLASFGLYLALVNLQSNIIYGVIKQQPHQDTLGILGGLLVFATGSSGIIWWLNDKK